MAFNLYPNCLVDSMETWISTDDEIRTTTKDLHLNCAEYGLQTLLTATEGSSVLTLDIQPICYEWVVETCLTPCDEICVLAFDILLICWDYGSKQNLLIILKFMHLHSNQQPICAVLELETWLALCLNTCIGTRHLLSLFSIITLRPVRQEENTSQENFTDMPRCNLGKFLVVPTFVARRLQVCKDARYPSGESWNYLSRRQACNFTEKTASTQFRNMFLATNLRQVRQTHTYLLRMCIQNVTCHKPHKKSNYSRPSDYRCYISFRNMNCANWRNSCIGARPKSIFAFNDL